MRQKRSHSITNPYSGARRSYTTTLTYLLNVPIRLRPALLLMFCLITFGLVYFNHAMRQATAMDRLVAQRQALELSRRYVPTDGGESGREDWSEQFHIEAENGGAQPTAQSLVFDSTKNDLAALISFITSTTSNVLPHVDPTVPLDPSIILDFDPTRPDARDDLHLLVDEMHIMYPVILLGRMRDPWHREVKKMLAEYRITPAPLIIDVDQRRDASIFLPIVSRLVDSPELPQLLLAGERLGSYHEVLELRESGKFVSTLEKSGLVSVRDVMKKKKGVKEIERMENERILGPAPIYGE